MQVTGLYRHPLKSHGREALQSVTLHKGQPMPFDRLWAVAHDASKADGSSWVPCLHFSRGSKAPGLMAVNATLDDEARALTLSHPKLPDLTFFPDTEVDRFIEWVKPIVPQDRALPDRILTLPGRGFTDTDFPSVSLSNMASHHAVESLAQSPLSPLRWRSNIWLDGAAPWAEFDWIGREVRLGGAVLHIEERIVRCLATTANPETGERDVDTLGLLKTLGHQDFGIYARVVQSGEVAVGDSVELI